MISTCSPLKQRQYVALDTGYVHHIAVSLVLVWEAGQIVRWGITTECLRTIESRRLWSAHLRRLCTSCRLRQDYAKQNNWVRRTHRYHGDYFHIWTSTYRNEGIGTFV